ncbi:MULTISPECIES: hypothetical protein [Salinibaculum]|uniref:hypothetical protein n=1 Tax=Salinibaculum TaxID=2732368 RepID=UPI0030D417F7
MPRAGPLKQLLTPLTLDELRYLRREFNLDISSYDGDKTGFRDRVHDALKYRIDNGQMTYQQVMESYRDEVVTNESKQVTTRIRETLNNLELSEGANRKEANEMWITSEAWQALRMAFQDEPYTVIQEETFGRRRVDLLVTHDHDARNYLIEFKLANRTGSLSRTYSQLREYQRAIEGLSRSWLVVVAPEERYLPEQKERVANMIEDVRQLDATEVIIVRPEDFRA